MATLITSTTGEVLDFYENENYEFIKGLSTTITQGTYVKLPTQEFIFVDFSAVEKVETLAKPLNYGYINNNAIQELDFTYEV